MNKKLLLKSILIVAIPLLSAGCQTINKVEIGDENMTCEQLRAEIGIKDKSREGDVKKIIAGAGIATAGVAAPFIAIGTVIAAPIIVPVAILGGATYGSVKAYDAYQNKERIAYLTDLYNKKGCASTTYASVPAASSSPSPNPNIKNIKRDEELLKVQKALSARGYELGVIDGIYGNKTKLALELFQKENDLEITGKADTATKALLLTYDIPRPTAVP